MLKRARVQAKAAAWSHARGSTDGHLPEEAWNTTDAGQKFRKFLLTKHCSGEYPACDLVRIAKLHTESGGTGLEDFCHGDERHASERVNLILGRTFKLPHLYYASVPGYDKHASRRIMMDVPMKLASETIAEVHSTPAPAAVLEA